MKHNTEPFKPKFKKLTKFEVHFDNNGDLSWYNTEWDKPAHKEPNSVFYDELTYNGFTRSRGGVHIFFTSSKTGCSVSMFMSDFDEVIKAGLFTDESIKGKFCYTKKGRTQGIRYFFEPRP